jgi:hypothetical protein
MGKEIWLFVTGLISFVGDPISLEVSVSLETEFELTLSITLILCDEGT